MMFVPRGDFRSVAKPTELTQLGWFEIGMHTAYLLVSCRSDLRNSSVVEDDDRTVLAKPVQQQRIDVVHPLAKVLHEDQGHARLPAQVPVGIAGPAGLDVLRDGGGVSV